MAKNRRSVLVTGVAHEWGGKLVPLLEADPDFATIIGIDYVKPEKKFNRLEFFQVECHHPLLAELIRAADVDVVCHLLFVDAYSQNEELFDLNVMGTMDLLAACGAGEAPKIVLMSDTRVYGAVPSHPNFLSEFTEFQPKYRHPYVTHRMEMEKIVDRFCRQNTDLKATVLRFANVLGWGVDTPMRRYLEAHLAPMAFGFDPMMQFTHEKDVLAALLHAIKADGVSGPFNIAGKGLLPLSQVIKIGKRVPLPFGAPFLAAGSAIFQKTPIPDSIPIATDFLKFNCVGDIARMRDVLGFFPRYSSKETVVDFFENLRLSRYLPGRRNIVSDPEATQNLQEYLGERQKASEYLADLIETFNKEHEYDQ